MNKVQTDNSYLYNKIYLRINNLPKQEVISVLNCYAGDNYIWDEIIRITNKNIILVNIDIKDKKDKFYLKGDNLKFIKNMDLSVFDVIDLDAYGIPFEQLEVIFKKQYKGCVFVTFIQSIMGRLPNKLLLNYGYNKSMIKRIPTLLCKNGISILKRYLASNGISKIIYKNHDNKTYMFFATIHTKTT